jgi:SAM-dependent methyltransferase
VTVIVDDHARAAYDALAPGYDALTGWHDHAGWAALLESLALASGLRGRRLLDVACGTGNTMLPMLARGYAATGVDVSGAMLEEARRKLPAGTALHRADMRALPALGEYDLVWALGDALNYVDDRAGLVATFAGFRRNVAPGGVVVFDVNTLATFRTLYSSLLVVPAGGRVVLVDGRGRPDVASGGRSCAWIDRLERQASGWWTRTRSEHRHRHHPEAVLREALEEAGLACSSVHGTHPDGTAEPALDELRHAKAVYTAPASAP